MHSSESQCHSCRMSAAHGAQSWTAPEPPGHLLVDLAVRSRLLLARPSALCSVDLPVEEVPPELPEPVLGINFARDGE